MMRHSRRGTAARRLSSTALIAFAAACSTEGAALGDSAVREQSPADEVPVVREAFVTPLDTLDNVDSPAVWHGPDGQHWLLSTAKEADVILVHEAATGQPIRRAGGPGTQPGQVERPNGIAVIGDVALVVERDNHRVQAFALPELRSLGVFGDRELRNPYGLAWSEIQPGVYGVYVSDNYEMPDESVPPDAQLGERIKHYRVSIAGGRVSAQHVRSFGDTSGDGVVRIVESVATDAAHGRLLVAEEDERDSHWKVYDLEGRFHSVFGRGRFPQQAEGLALYACGDTAGYWIATDQGPAVNTFHVFDRLTFRHLGAFRGAVANTTDGVALTQRSFGPFPAGAFYASHFDAGVAAFSWADIAAAVGLRADCTG